MSAEGAALTRLRVGRLDPESGGNLRKLLLRPPPVACLWRAFRKKSDGLYGKRVDNGEITGMPGKVRAQTGSAANHVRRLRQ